MKHAGPCGASPLAESCSPPRRGRSTLRRILVAGLAVAGGWFVATGLQHWLDERAAARVVEEFLAAVRDGDRDTVLSHLSAARRKTVERRGEEVLAPLAQPTAGFRWRIRELRLDRRQGTVRVEFERDGFLAESAFHLVRAATGSWKIDRVESVRLDPRLEPLRRAADRKAGEQTAEELKRALRGRPGVTVERPAER